VETSTRIMVATPGRPATELRSWTTLIRAVTTDSAPWGELPRGDTVGTLDALHQTDVLLAHAGCRGRAVRYALDRDPTPLSREEVEAWLTSAEAEGLTLARYVVDPRGAGPVQVALCAIQPTQPASSD
jgi:hypothetical protein